MVVGIARISEKTNEQLVKGTEEVSLRRLYEPVKSTLINSTALLRDSGAWCLTSPDSRGRDLLLDQTKSSDGGTAFQLTATSISSSELFFEGLHWVLLLWRANVAFIVALRLKGSGLQIWPQQAVEVCFIWGGLLYLHIDTELALTVSADFVAIVQRQWGLAGCIWWVTDLLLLQVLLYMYSVYLLHMYHYNSLSTAHDHETQARHCADLVLGQAIKTQVGWKLLPASSLAQRSGLFRQTSEVLFDRWACLRGPGDISAATCSLPTRQDIRTVTPMTLWIVVYWTVVDIKGNCQPISCMKWNFPLTPGALSFSFMPWVTWLANSYS